MRRAFNHKGASSHPVEVLVTSPSARCERSARVMGAQKHSRDGFASGTRTGSSTIVGSTQVGSVADRSVRRSRRVMYAKAANASPVTAAIAAATCMPSTNRSRATASSASAELAGRVSATPTAPPNVSRPQSPHRVEGPSRAKGRGRPGRSLHLCSRAARARARRRAPRPSR